MERIEAVSPPVKVQVGISPFIIQVVSIAAVLIIVIAAGIIYYRRRHTA